MQNLKIVRANGDIELADLTTDKTLVGENYIKVVLGGVDYYAKLGPVLDTHMFSIFNGEKLYVQKQIMPSGSWSLSLGESLTVDIPDSITVVEVTYDGNKQKYLAVQPGKSATLTVIQVSQFIFFRLIQKKPSGRDKIQNIQIQMPDVIVSYGPDINAHGAD